MIETWIQFFRNFFCVLKSVTPLPNFPFKEYFATLHHKVHSETNGLLSKETTVVEYIIAPLQFLAIVFNFVNGMNALQHGYHAYHKNNKYIQLLDRLSLENKHKSCYFTVVRNRLVHDINHNLHEMITGFFQLVLANGFFFLMCNSLHIVGANHPKRVIDALIGQEVALLYFLGVMVHNYFKCMTNYSEYHDVAALMNNLNSNYQGISDSKLLTFLFGYGYGTERLYEALVAIKPDYSVLSEYIHNDVMMAEIDYQMTNLLILELQATEALLHYLTQASSKESHAFREKCMVDLKLKSVQNLAKSSLELVYLALNVIAGYGYLIGILAYYLPHASLTTAPYWLKCMYFGLSPVDADWIGNLAGDAAWSVEPLLVIAVGNYFHSSETCISSGGTGGVVVDEEDEVHFKYDSGVLLSPSKSLSAAAALKRSSTPSSKKNNTATASVTSASSSKSAKKASSLSSSAAAAAVKEDVEETPVMVSATKKPSTKAATAASRRSDTPSKKRADTPSKKRTTSVTAAEQEEADAEKEIAHAAASTTTTRRTGRANAGTKNRGNE